MRILAFTPTFGDGPRPEMLASVRAQACAGEIVHEVSWHNPFPPPDARNVLAQFVRGRELALDGGFDALWLIEHDMWAPPDAVQKLWELTDSTGQAALARLSRSPVQNDRRAGVAYGVYLFRHGVAVVNAFEYYGPGSRNLGESLSLPRNRSKLDRAMRDGLIEVSGAGFGCTLIRRDVFERIPFRSGETGTEAPDIPFATDCLRAGIWQVAHFGVLCGHWDGKRWLMPLGSTDMGEMVHVRALHTVYVGIGGGSKELIAGREYDLPAHEVPEIVRGGWVTVIEQPIERAVLPERKRAVGRAQRTEERDGREGR